MHHYVRLEGGKHTLHCLLITDVQVMKRVAFGAGSIGNRLQISGIGKLVDICNHVHSVGQQVTDDSRANETGTTGDEDARTHVCSWHGSLG